MPPNQPVSISNDIPGSYVLNDFTLESQIGTTLDLRKVFMQCTIYEDLMSPFITGNIDIADGFGLYNNFPVVGNEIFHLNFASNADDTTTDSPFQRDFYTYKVSDKEHLKQDLTTYTIYFATKEFEENLKTKVSKAYSNMKASDMVQLLMTEQPPRGLGSTQNLNIETTFYSDNAIIPYWSPIEAIEWLASRSISDQNHNAANFVFFENRDGFNFVSVESLLKKTPSITYGRSVKNVDATQKFLYGVESYKVFDTQDIANNIQAGMYASNLLTHDIVKKSLNKITYDYLKAFPTTTHVDENPLVSTVSQRNTRPDSHFKYYPIHSNQFNSAATPTNNSDKWLLPRNSLLIQLGVFRLVIKVKGSTGVQVGDVVNFKLMQQNPQNPNAWVPDKYNNGKYLITSIKHILDFDEYSQYIEMVRDGYSDKLA